MPNVFINLAWVALSILVSVISSVFGFFEPTVVLSVAPTAITAISIIFGLSMALITITAGFTPISPGAILKEGTRIQVENDVARDDSRTVFRQKLLILLFLASVLSGIFFLGASSHSPCSWTTSVASSVFCLLATLSLTLACFLPFTIAALVNRNSDFRTPS